MKSIITILAATAALGLGSAKAQGTSDHFVLTQAGTLAIMRVDPIVNPGDISGHLHTIMGGSLFGANLGQPGDLVNSECTTTIVGDDKSNYWSPSLMYKYENGSLSHILHQSRIYYFMKTDDVKPFPPGLRMISGNPSNRNASDPRAMGVRFNCNHDKQTQELPTQTPGRGPCSGIGAGIFFPSCGLADGSLDSENHFDHMTWPIDSPAGVTPNGHKCPDSHPIKYPTIFMEVNYYLTAEQPWREDPDLLVLSNGDTVGTTYHADFHNGWVPKTLAATIKQCGAGKSVGDKLEDCPPLAKSFQPEALRQCHLQGDVVDEDVGLFRPLDKLPGCNKIWTAEMGDARPVCKEEQKPSFIKPSLFFNNLRYWLAVPISDPSGVEVSTEGNVLPDIPSLGFRGASTLQKWIWGDADSEDALQPEIVPSADASEADSVTKPVASSSSSPKAAVPTTTLVSNAAIVDSPGDAPSPSSVATESTAKAPSVSGSNSRSSAGDSTTSTSSLGVGPTADVVSRPKSCKRSKRNLLARHRKRASFRRH